MKTTILAVSICIILSGPAHSGGIPVLTAISDALSAMKLSEAFLQTAQGVKAAADRTTQIANQVRQYTQLVAQLKALTESGGLENLLQGMAMDEFREMMPELAGTVDFFNSQVGTFRDSGALLQKISGIFASDEIFKEVGALTDAAIAVKDAYDAGRQAIGVRHGTAYATIHGTKRDIERSIDLIGNVRRAQNVKQVQLVNTQINGQILVNQSRHMQLTAMQLEHESEKQAKEMAAIAKYKANTYEMINRDF